MLNPKGESPEDWMCGTPATPQDSARQAARETIRQWYDRSTKSVRKALVWATAFAFIGAAVMYAMASLPFLARLQTFNGALTIPIAGLIWLLAFVYVFLVPSREASFRGQEWIETMVTLVEQTVREQVAPAAVVWRHLGERIDREFPALTQDVHEGLEAVKTAAAKLEAAVEKNKAVGEDAAPAIEALKRIEARLEHEIKTGLFEDVRSAAQAVKKFAAPEVPRPEDMPKFGVALAMLNKKP